MIERAFSVMHSDALIALQPSGAESSATGRALALAESRARELELIFSRFIPASELCALNASSGDWVVVSRSMGDVLELALALHHETGGIFDPAILPELEHAGYDRSFEELPADRASQAGPARAHPSFADVEVRRGRARLPRGMRIDLGGIVKGWVADALADDLARFGPVLVDLGGDVATRGAPREVWQIGVQAPGDSGGLIALLTIAEGSIATSGTDRMRWRVNGEWAHHLIDPRTGRPAATDLRQVTALGSRAARAEVWAKTALILGARGARALVASHPDLDLLLVPVDGAPVATPGMRAVASTVAGVAA